MLVRNVLRLNNSKNLLEIEGYNLVRKGHLNNVKRGGVCTYYEGSLSVRTINLLYFNEAFLLEMSHSYKNAIVLVIYRSPSQKNDELDLFLSNFEKLLIDIKNRKLYLSVITGDFNDRLSSWWYNEINTTEGTKLFAQTSSDRFQQLINKSNNIQKKLDLLVLILFSLQFSQTCPLIMKFMHLNIHTVRIKLFM